MRRLTSGVFGSRLAVAVTSVIVTATLISGGIAMASVANNSVTSAKIRNGAVKSIDIRNGTITGADIKTGAVKGTDIANGSVGKADLAASARPGAASDASAIGNVGSAVAIPTVILSDPITVPSAGNLVVTAAWNVDMVDFDAVECWVSLDSLAPSGSLARQELFATGITGIASIPGSVTDVLPGVTAGPHTVYLVCKYLAGSPPIDIGTPTMTTLFVPGTL